MSTPVNDENKLLQQSDREDSYSPRATSNPVPITSPHANSLCETNSVDSFQHDHSLISMRSESPVNSYNASPTTSPNEIFAPKIQTPNNHELHITPQQQQQAAHQTSLNDSIILSGGSVAPKRRAFRKISQPVGSSIHIHDKSIVAGFLNKLSDGKFNKGKWHRRWFVLDREMGVLRYFSSEKEAKAARKGDRSKDAFDLNCCAAAVILEIPAGVDKPFFFQVSMNGTDIDQKRGSVLKLCADTQSDYDIWTSEIQYCVGRKFRDDGYLIPSNINPASAASSSGEESDYYNNNDNRPEIPNIDTNLATLNTDAIQNSEQLLLSQNGQSILDSGRRRQRSTKNIPLSRQPSSGFERRKARSVAETTPGKLMGWKRITWKQIILINAIMLISRLSPDYVFTILMVTMNMGMLYHYLKTRKAPLTPVPSNSSFSSPLVADALSSMPRDESLMSGESPLASLEGRTSPTVAWSNPESPDLSPNESESVATEHVNLLHAAQEHTSDETPPKIGGKSFIKESPPSPHHWDDADASNFQLRIGPDYRRNKLKGPSGPSIAKTVGVDIFRTNQKLVHIFPQIKLDPNLVPEGAHLFVINLMLPSYAPGVWQKVWDGPGYSLVVYMVIPESTMNEVKTANTGHLSLLRRFINAHKEIDPKAIYDRMKMIGRLVNPDELELYSTERSLVTKYNAKPVLTRPQHLIFHGSNYTEVDVDVHTFGLIGRKGLNGFMPRIKLMVLEIGFVIEAESNDEQPEVLLGCLRANRMDLNLGVKWEEAPFWVDEPTLELPCQHSPAPADSSEHENKTTTNDELHSTH